MATRSRRELVRGRVAAILSQREVVLNIGSEAGVEPGMRFVILNETGVPAIDPDTGDEIGTIEVPKHVVKIVRVDGPRLSVARTFRVIKGRPGLAGHNLFGPTSDRVETLNLEQGSTIKEDLEGGGAVVRIGDKAVETVGEEYDD